MTRKIHHTYFRCLKNLGTILMTNRTKLTLLQSYDICDFGIKRLLSVPSISYYCILFLLFFNFSTQKKNQCSRQQRNSSRILVKIPLAKCSRLCLISSLSVPSIYFFTFYHEFLFTRASSAS